MKNYFQADDIQIILCICYVSNRTLASLFSFPGLISKLDHFVDLQIDSIWITPFYDSPKNDNGYDISNYTAVDPVFGTLADFEELSKQATKRGR